VKASFFIGFWLFLLGCFSVHAQQLESWKAEMTRGFNTMNAQSLFSKPDSRFDVSYYGLHLNVNPSLRHINGYADLLLDIRESTQIVELELISTLQIDSIYVVDEDRLASWSRSTAPVDYIISVDLGQQLLAGDQVRIQVYYQGEPGTSGFGSFVFATNSGQPAFWTLSQPFGARDWFPNKNTPNYKADSSDVVVTIPSNLKLGSNGLLESVEEVGSGLKKWHWKSRYPISHYLISIAAADYEEFTDYFHYSPTDSMPVLNYVYRSVNFESVRNQAALTIDMLGLFTELFGEYPFIEEKYGHAMFLRSGGMEHQTMSSMNNFGRGLIAHELAHQWFGNAVTCRGWEDIWLNESFATYAEGLVIEAFDDAIDFRSWRFGHQSRVTEFPDGRVFVPSASINPSDPGASVQRIFRYRTSYAKGALVLHMLRRKVGDEVFFNTLKEYLQIFRFGTADTEDLIELFETQSGKHLRPFFNAWIYGEGHPEYELRYAAQPAGSGGFRMQFRLTQESSMPGITNFDVPIEIRVPYQNGQGDTTYVFEPDTFPYEAEVFIKESPGFPVIDPDLHVLTVRKDVIPATFGNLDQQLPFLTELLANYPNPFNPSTTIPFRLGQPGTVLIEIYNTNGQRVATVINTFRSAGFHTVNWDAGGLSSGVYFIRLQHEDSIQIRKTVLLR